MLTQNKGITRPDTNNCELQTAGKNSSLIKPQNYTLGKHRTEVHQDFKVLKPVADTANSSPSWHRQRLLQKVLSFCLSPFITIFLTLNK